MGKGYFMTVSNQENQVQENKTSDKELNFRALEQKYERQLAQERTAREQAERLAREAQEKTQKPEEEEEDDSEPYVDHKKLSKTLNRFGQSTHSEIQKAMEVAKQKAKEELKQELWLESNPDFYEILQHADKFAEKAPKLAESILRMPEGFERQKLVYENIKQMGVHKPEEAKPSIQEKIDANRKSPYYQPSGINAGPYAGASDFSPSGQKNAYQKMQELKRRLGY